MGFFWKIPACANLSEKGSKMFNNIVSAGLSKCLKDVVCHLSSMSFVNLAKDVPCLEQHLR